MTDLPGMEEIQFKLLSKETVQLWYYDNHIIDNGMLKSYTN